jgi:hypothetical protein
MEIVRAQFLSDFTATAICRMASYTFSFVCLLSLALCDRVRRNDQKRKCRDKYC